MKTKLRDCCDYEKKIKPGHDYIGVGGGVLIFNKNKEVFLMKRANTRNEDGWWSKPGGGVEYGEKAINSMKREIKEEAGIDIDIWGYLPHTDHIIKKINSTGWRLIISEGLNRE